MERHQPQNLHLRLVTDKDTDTLHDLFCIPGVYRYLADGAAPDRNITRQWIKQSEMDSAAAPGVGLFVLEDAERRIHGCVRTHLLNEPGLAELTYVLHPALWGRGLATDMAWTAMQRAFASGRVNTMIAGTDDPNEASLRVMHRLGMRFLRRTQNPRWPGVEYVRQRADPLPGPVPRTLALGKPTLEA